MLNIVPRRSVNFSSRAYSIIPGLVRKGQIYTGPHIDRFKEKFTEYIGLKHIAGVSLARSGFCLLLKAMDFKPGDEIIMPSYNFHILPIIAKMLHLEPVFVDISDKTNNIDVSLIEKKITPRTRAILVVHMSGLPCDLDPILDIARRNNLKIIEDCAQALGAEYKGKKVGSFGDVSFFSFDFNKNMPCFLGGIVATNDISIYEKFLGLFEEFKSSDKKSFWRNVCTNTILYLAMKKEVFPFTTYPILRILDICNSDLVDRLTHSEVVMPSSVPRHYKMPFTNLQAAVGLEQIKRLEYLNQKTMENAAILNEQLRDEPDIGIPVGLPGCKNIYLYYRITVKDPVLFRKKLLRKGVDSLKSCMLACSEIEFFSSSEITYPLSVRAARNGLEIPNGPFLTKDNMIYIARSISEVNKEIHKK